MHVLDALADLAHKDGANLFGELKIVVDDSLKEFATGNTKMLRSVDLLDSYHEGRSQAILTVRL